MEEDFGNGNATYEDGTLIEELEEPFENYSAGNFGDGNNNPTYDYLQALRAVNLLEPFENYSAGNFGDGDNSYNHNYIMAVRAIYNQPSNLYGGDFGKCPASKSWEEEYINNDDEEEEYDEYDEEDYDVIENFDENVHSFNSAHQNELFDEGDYVDYYHNLYSNV